MRVTLMRLRGVRRVGRMAVHHLMSSPSTGHPMGHLMLLRERACGGTMLRHLSGLSMLRRLLMAHMLSTLHLLGSWMLLRDCIRSHRAVLWPWYVHGVVTGHHTAIATHRCIGMVPRE